MIKDDNRKYEESEESGAQDQAGGIKKKKRFAFVSVRRKILTPRRCKHVIVRIGACRNA